MTSQQNNIKNRSKILKKNSELKDNKKRGNVKKNIKDIISNSNNPWQIWIHI